MDALVDGLIELRSLLTDLLTHLMPGPGTRALLPDVLVVLGTFVGLLALWLLVLRRPGGGEEVERDRALEEAREQLRDTRQGSEVPLAASSIRSEMAAARKALEEAGVEARVDGDRRLPIGPTFFTWYGLYVSPSDADGAREALEETEFDELLLPTKLVEKARHDVPSDRLF